MVRKGYSYRQLVEDINGQGGIQVVRGGKLEKGYSQLKSETDKDKYSQLKKDLMRVVDHTYGTTKRKGTRGKGSPWV